MRLKLGRSPYSPILVTVKDSEDKMSILSNAKKLKDKVNSYGKPYRIDEQLPAALREKKMRARHLVTTNYHLDGAEQLKMERKNGGLEVDGEMYEKQVRPPTLSEILHASKEQRLERLKFNVVKSEAVKLEGSTFIGYSALVANLQEVNQAYARIKAAHCDARHVICGFRIPNTAFHQYQDFYDDDEHGAGRMLLRALRWKILEIT